MKKIYVQEDYIETLDTWIYSCTVPIDDAKPGDYGYIELSDEEYNRISRAIDEFWEVQKLLKERYELFESKEKDK